MTESTGRPYIVFCHVWPVGIPGCGNLHSQGSTFGDRGVYLLTHDYNDGDHDIQGGPFLDDWDILCKYDAATEGERHGCVVLAEKLELVPMPAQATAVQR